MALFATVPAFLFHTNTFVNPDTSSNLDWIDWFNFLQMLSVERTEPFAGELNLPFDPESFTEAMRWARARLEVDYAPRISGMDQDPEFAGSARAWDKYRKADGVLSDEALSRLTGLSKNIRVADQLIFAELGTSFGPDFVDSLTEWFWDNFGTYGGPVWYWPIAIELLFKDDSAGIIPNTLAPLSSKERQYVRSFRIRYGGLERKMEFRFEVIGFAATATLLSPWEAFLQTAGGGHNHPWLANVGECLKYRMLRRQWARLTAQLGPDVMEKFVRWLKDQEELLQFHMPLPDPPRPLL